MCREVVEVYSFVSAPACQDYLLCLIWDRCGGWRQCQTPDGGGMGIEEKGVCELDFGLG
jgi:hypothetical protein